MSWRRRVRTDSDGHRRYFQDPGVVRAQLASGTASRLVWAAAHLLCDLQEDVGEILALMSPTWPQLAEKMIDMGSLLGLQRLLSVGLDPNTRLAPGEDDYHDDHSLLDRAVQCGQSGMVRLLLAAGARSGLVALRTALRARDWPTALLLTRMGAPVAGWSPDSLRGLTTVVASRTSGQDEQDLRRRLHWLLLGLNSDVRRALLRRPDQARDAAARALQRTLSQAVGRNLARYLWQAV